jgi:hypothetical protein
VTTAVDTNILLDVLIPDAPHGDESESALFTAAASGAVVVSDVAYAELAAQFSGPDELDNVLSAMGVKRQPPSAQALHVAGQAWARYLESRGPTFDCPRCGVAVHVQCAKCGVAVTRRQHVLADFLIGAHALVHTGRLLTRDRGYYGRYFPGLVLV